MRAASAHTYGFAIDIKTRGLGVLGKSDTDMACLVKLAGDSVLGVPAVGC